MPIHGKDAGRLTKVYFLNRRILASLSNILVVKGGNAYRRSSLTNLWRVSNAALHLEGGVRFTSGKKPEELIQKIIEAFSKEKDLVIDFFIGSGTTSAVAQKVARHWIGVEGSEKLFEMAKFRLKRVLMEEESGVSKGVKWQGGGFFKYHYLEQYEDTLNNLTIMREQDDNGAPDRFLANGPCFVEGTEAIEPEFKRLMFAEVT